MSSGYLRHGAGAFGLAFREFFFGDAFFGVDFGALGAGDVFHFFQQFFGRFDFAVVFLAGDHLLEQAVFSFGDFVFGHLHFVLQGFISFVGFYLRGLVFVFADAVFPLLDVQFVFFAIFHGGELGGFAFFDVRTWQRRCERPLRRFSWERRPGASGHPAGACRRFAGRAGSVGPSAL